MADIGTAYVRVAPNMTGIQGKIAAGFKGSAGPATAALGAEIESNSGPFQNALGKLGGVAKVGGLAIASGIAAGAAGLAVLATKSLAAGAELEQQLGGSEAVFGQYAKNIQAMADDAYTNAGLSQNEFLAGANKMGSLFQGAGFSVEKSMQMAADSMQRASDVASIMGIDTTSALEAVQGMAKGNFTMMDNLGVAMNDTAIGAFALSKGINKSTSQMSIQEKVGLAQQMFLEKTAKYAGNYAKENDTLAGSINTTKKAFQDFMATGNVTGFVNSLVSTIKIAVPKIIEMLPKLVQGITSIFSALVPALSAALPVLIPALIGAVVSLLNSLVAALPSIVKVLVDAMPILITAFIQLFLAILKALPEIINIIAQAMPTIITALVNGLTAPSALQAIIMGAVQLLLALIQAIPIILPALIRAIPIIIKNIYAVLTSSAFIGQMMNAGVQLLQAVIRGLMSMIWAVGSAAWQILKAITDVLSPNNMLRIGTDVVRGLWNGIASMGGWLRDRIVSFVRDKIPGPVRDALGIHSPSKVFAEIGREIPRGLVKGVDKNSAMVTRSVSNMADAAMSGIYNPAMNASVAFGASAAAGSGVNSTGNTTSQEVNIGTVALGDATAVQEFFKQLNQDTIRVGMGLTPNQGAI
jgi:phage-related protein